METPEDRKKRLNRERQRRYRMNPDNTEKIRQRQRQAHAARKALKDLGL